MLKKIIFIAGLAIISTNVEASKQRSFTKLDANQDQQLTLKEFLKAVNNTDRMSKVFNFRDKDGDGVLSNEEYMLKKKKRKKNN